MYFIPDLELIVSQLLFYNFFLLGEKNPDLFPQQSDNKVLQVEEDFWDVVDPGLRLLPEPVRRVGLEIRQQVKLMLDVL